MLFRSVAAERHLFPGRELQAAVCAEVNHRVGSEAVLRPEVGADVGVGRIIGLLEFFASAFLQKNSIFFLSDDLIIKVNCLCSIFKVNYHQRVGILMR